MKPDFRRKIRLIKLKIRGFFEENLKFEAKNRVFGAFGTIFFIKIHYPSHLYDQVVVDTALVHVVKFTRKEKFLRALVSSEPLVNAIVHQLNCAKKVLLIIKYY